MDKRYQVFVSSTYADLKEERQNVIQALMEMDCIPAGMELFPASDEEQWEFIKKIIDDCDYYLLIIGGRYGSLSADGISYTEKEFDYAVEKGLKVVALVHGEPNNIPFEKSETNPELREKLISFRQKVTTDRLVKFWTQASELPGLVALSLTKTIKMYPAIGWVRANQANLLANSEILAEINQIRKEKAELQKTMQQLLFENENSNLIKDIANFDSTFDINGSYSYYGQYNILRTDSFNVSISWRDLFTLISPYIAEMPSSAKVKTIISEFLFKKSSLFREKATTSIDDQQFKTIAIQFESYGLIETNYAQTTKGTMATFWTLTKKGRQIMIENRIIKD
ncbi:TPA: DUF4062 domain-containing protein [Providencia alcalifaciens]